MTEMRSVAAEASRPEVELGKTVTKLVRGDPLVEPFKSAPTASMSAKFSLDGKVVYRYAQNADGRKPRYQYVSDVKIDTLGVEDPLAKGVGQEWYTFVVDKKKYKPITANDSFSQWLSSLPRANKAEAATGGPSASDTIALYKVQCSYKAADGRVVQQTTTAVAYDAENVILAADNYAVLALRDGMVFHDLSPLTLTRDGVSLPVPCEAVKAYMGPGGEPTPFGVVRIRTPGVKKLKLASPAIGQGVVSHTLLVKRGSVTGGETVSEVPDLVVPLSDSTDSVKQLTFKRAIAYTCSSEDGDCGSPVMQGMNQIVGIHVATGVMSGRTVNYFVPLT
jgi:hypothetical protein